MKEGIIFNIQRYSIQDGPGIRTTVFFKGCSLHCSWCSNPESINKYTEIMIEGHLCCGCETCIEVCPVNCIELDEERQRPVIDRVHCDACGICIDNCKTGALKIIGKKETVAEITKEILKDHLFYKNSGGGVTFSGGEALLQKDFLLEILKECKKNKIHTAVDTCGFVSWELMEEIIDYVDLFLYDIKHIDAEKHIEGTGASNDIILQNAKELSKRKKRMWIRTPIIPGYNDDISVLKKIIVLAQELHAEKISFLGYFDFAKVKYDCLDREYDLKSIDPMEKEQLMQIKELVEDNLIHIPITIGF